MLKDLNSIEIQVFVSCPSDLVPEKRAVEEVCKRVNANLKSIGCNIRLAYRDCSEIIGPTGIRPQQLINDSINDYDIYLGILYMRFGTPTGATNKLSGEEWESGTEEEFVLACENKKAGKNPTAIYLFFKEQIGSKNAVENEQAGKVLRFKEKLMPSDWINAFKSIEQFERDISDLLTRITTKIYVDQLIETKHINIVNIVNKPKIDVFSFVPDFPNLPTYIPTSISLFEPVENNESVLLKVNTGKILIHEILNTEKKIVLLGNAGSGKSTELQQIAKFYLNPDTRFIPIYKRFNTYANEDIEDFLPTGWKELDPEVTLILFDGLDEIQPQYFNTAVSKIIDFTERHKNTRIIITCRTNFYELPSESFSGTLTGFSTCILNDISLTEIKNYITSNFAVDAEKLIQDAYEGSVLDLIQKPFFLNILIKHYKQKGNFTEGLVSIIEAAVFSKIDSDKEHFKTTISSPKTKLSILRLLEKVAFVMEVMGKNFISDNELEKVLVDSKDLEQIKYFSAFTKNVQNGQWMFEHNNIQEFLASRVLVRQPFQKLIETISFPTSYNKIKPTWINTLSFLISTADETLLGNIVDWLNDNEREIIVKFDRDRINRNFRIELFKKIFNFYKEKNIWLKSNKFNDNEFARFGADPEVLDFLISEMSNTSNTRIVILNAISTLKNFFLDEFEPSFKIKIKDKLITILENNKHDCSMINSILYAIAKMQMTDKETVDYFLSKYGKRKNQYIRAGLYKLINKSGEQSNYVEFFLEGLGLITRMHSVEDRENLNLADESWLLEEGIGKIKEPEAIKKILLYFTDPLNRYINIRTERETVTKVIQNAFHAYSQDHSIYDYVFDLLVKAAKNYDRHFAAMIIPFFEQTEKKWIVFKNIWFYESVTENDKSFILQLLIDKSIIDNFLNGYSNRDFSNQDAIKMHKLLMWQFNPQDKNFYLIDEFENRITEVFGLRLKSVERIDWTTIQKKKTQESFNLLFKKADLIKEIKAIFIKIGLEELKQEDLREVRINSYEQSDDYFAESALEAIRECIVNKGKNCYNDIKNWILESHTFSQYQIEEIYEYLFNKRHLIDLFETQVNFISEWCQKIVTDMDIENGIKVQHTNENYLSVDNNVIKLWFFIRELNITLPQKKLLDFTLFRNYNKPENLKESEIFTVLGKYINKEKIDQRVIENISSGIIVDDVWKDNAGYAVINNLRSAIPFILKDLANTNKTRHARCEILESYFKKTRDLDSLRRILQQISMDELRWDIIRLLLQHKTQHLFLIDYLNKVLKNNNELIDNQIDAANYLMTLNELNGFVFIANYVLEKKDPQIDFRNRFTSLSKLKQPAAIPLLIDLLKLAKQKDFQTDNFNNLEPIVLDALHNIGICSEENFILIKDSFKKLIGENRDTDKNLNFLHFTLKRIEEVLYLNMSKNYAIEDAIIEFDKLKNK
jgi:hypothetical protein